MEKLDGKSEPLFAIVFTRRGLLYLTATLLFLIITAFVVFKVATQPVDQKKIVVTPAPAPKKPRGPFGTPAEVLEDLYESREK